MRDTACAAPAAPRGGGRSLYDSPIAAASGAASRKMAAYWTRRTPAAPSAMGCEMARMAPSPPLRFAIHLRRCVEKSAP